MSDVPAVKLASVPVWDLPLRLFHWSLLAAVATAAVTGFLLLPPWLNLHLIAGTIIIALLLFRFVWGFTGSTFSRFRSFMFSPRETLRHALGLMRGEPMAISANPKRFTDMTEVEKWFDRNCNSVLGRACTPQEQGDVAAWLISQ